MNLIRLVNALRCAYLRSLINLTDMTEASKKESIYFDKIFVDKKTKGKNNNNMLCFYHGEQNGIVQFHLFVSYHLR